MIFLLVIFSVLWFVKTTKSSFFYIYLWQLKEYQIRRLLDHFRTTKGKRLIFNELNFVRIILVVTFFFQDAIFLYLVFALYLLEFFKVFLGLYKRRLKTPVFTRKTGVLIFAAVFLESLFLLFLFLKIGIVFWFPLWLLVFDILAPVIFSLVVLFFQPLTVLLRNQIIRKAKKKRDKFKDLLVIGITGSYGKTSTKEFLATILSERFNVLKTKEHQNSEVGISQCILNDLKEDHQVFIVEMGAYGRGGIKLLCDIVKPKIGILTGINEQHLALFGSQKKIIKTKFELIESLPEEGTAIFNWDNEFIKNRFKIPAFAEASAGRQNSELKPKTKKFCSIRVKNDVWAEEIKIEKELVSFKAFSKDGDSAYFKVNLLGGQNVENILLAVCCAKEMGMSLEEISRACLKIKPEQGSIKFLRKGDLTVLDASYSANPKGVIADLDYLKLYSGKRVIIMPCLIELGKASKEVHRKIGIKIAEVCNSAIITTKERFQEIKESALDNGMPEENILYLENLKKIIDKIRYIPAIDSAILLEGRVPGELINWLSSFK